MSVTLDQLNTIEDQSRYYKVNDLWTIHKRGDGVLSVAFYRQSTSWHAEQQGVELVFLPIQFSDARQLLDFVDTLIKNPVVNDYYKR